MSDKMTLPKAVEILDLYSKSPVLKQETDFLFAIKLGKEAINRILLARSYNDQHTLHHLPGED